MCLSSVPAFAQLQLSALAILQAVWEASGYPLGAWCGPSRGDRLYVA